MCVPLTGGHRKSKTCTSTTARFTVLFREMERQTNLLLNKGKPQARRMWASVISSSSAYSSERCSLFMLLISHRVVKLDLSARMCHRMNFRDECAAQGVSIFSDRNKYAVETKQGKKSSFDAVGSQQIFEAFDRKEAVKRVKRSLVPCRSALSVLLA